METRKLGVTDMEFSLIGLGTMTFGNQNSEKEAHQQFDLALERGVNWMDLAEMYPVPPHKDRYGDTERVAASYLKKSGKRDDWLVATKVSGKAAGFDYMRPWPGGTCLDKKNIDHAVEGSLRRLGVDHIDFYQIHFPDRSSNFFGNLNYRHNPDDVAVPMEETLAALASHVEAGRIRAIGVSNETPWGMHKYLSMAATGLPRAMAIQNPYNLLNRSFEVGCAEIAIRENFGLLAYSPLAFGALSGKYLNNAMPKGSRFDLFPEFQRYRNERGDLATEAYCQLARENGLDPSAMAIAFICQQPFVTSVIIGATNISQLEIDLSGCDVKLDQKVLEGIEKIGEIYPNPCP